MSQIRTHPWRGNSVSQILSYRLSPRKWWFQKIAKLPEVTKGSFDYGNTLHALLENYLKGHDDPFLPGWDAKVDLGQALHIKSQVEQAIANGVVKRLPNALEPEKGFKIQMADGLPLLFGYVDYATKDGLIEDHKSTASRKWAKSKQDLQTDPQTMTYATILGAFWLDKDERPEVFRAVHNNFSKSDISDVWKTEEAVFTQEDLEKNWNECVETSYKMLADSKKTKWQDLECTSPCKSAFGGCPFKDICAQRTTIEGYVESTYEQLKFQDALSGESSTPIQDKNMSGLSGLDALKAGGSSKPAPQVVPAAQVAPTEQPAATPPVQETPPQTGGPAPWADATCVACGGSGWQSKYPSPCRICAINASTRGAPTPNQFRIEVNGGVPQAVPLDGGDPVNGSMPAQPQPQQAAPEPVQQPSPLVIVDEAPDAPDLANIVTPVAAQEPAPAPQEAPMAGTAQPVSQPQQAAPEPAQQPEPQPAQEQQRAFGYMLAIGAYPALCEGSQFPVRSIVSLTDLVFYGPLGKEIATSLKVSSYAAANALKRKDLLMAVGPEWIQANCSGVLIVSTDHSPEIRELSELLSIKAEITFRAVL